MPTAKKTCDECVWSIAIEQGYSNYTVEGVVIHCAKSLNPGLPEDRFYGKDKVLTFATTCKEYKHTARPVVVDVDRDNDFPKGYTNKRITKKMLEVADANS